MSSVSVNHYQSVSDISDLVTMGDTVQEVDCDLTKEQVAELKQAFDMFDR